MSKIKMKQDGDKREKEKKMIKKNIDEVNKARKSQKPICHILTLYKNRKGNFMKAESCINHIPSKSSEELKSY